jgi:hypothetical protein
VVQSKPHVWATEVRTPLGLVEEGNGTFTLFYTANEKISGAHADEYGVNVTPGALGSVEVRLREERGEGSSARIPVRDGRETPSGDLMRLAARSDLLDWLEKNSSGSNRFGRPAIPSGDSSSPALKLISRDQSRDNSE